MTCAIVTWHLFSNVKGRACDFIALQSEPVWNGSVEMSKGVASVDGRDFDLNLIWEKSDGVDGILEHESNELCFPF